MDFNLFFLEVPLREGLFWIKTLWFLWAPLVLWAIFWSRWLSYVRDLFLRNISWTLLEIKLPREIYKSPKAMEVVLTSLYSASEGGWWDRVWKGFLAHWYSLEVASINGDIRFFIYTQKSLRNLVESQVYAQYPGVEIVEVSDYTLGSDFEDLKEWNLWGAEFGLSEPDAYPIKTYVDFGLHETSTEEEQKVNPQVSFLEFLGSLKEGEQVWFQLMIKGAGDGWIKEGRELVDKLLGQKKEDSEEKKVSKREQEVASAIERNISKQGFKSGLRVIYLARRDVFNSVNIASVFGSLNQYKSVNLNGFRPIKTVSGGFFFKARRELKNKKAMLDAFRKRGYFYQPYSGKPFVLNTEELATIFHFPGKVAETPSFARIESKKGKPPTTLPI